jgi:hypothetical protein
MSDSQVYGGNGNSAYANFGTVAAFDSFVFQHLLTPSPAAFNREQQCSVTTPMTIPFLQETLCGIYWFLL